MKKENFEKLVKEAILNLPERIRKKMNNVAVVVEEEPSKEELKKSGIRIKSSLLGLYQGIPQTKWGRDFGQTLPDKITIFQKSIENFASTPEKIKELVKITVWHEIAHHFGIGERRVRELEKKWKEKKFKSPRTAGF